MWQAVRVRWESGLEVVEYRDKLDARRRLFVFETCSESSDARMSRPGSDLNEVKQSVLVTFTISRRP